MDARCCMFGTPQAELFLYQKEDIVQLLAADGCVESDMMRFSVGGSVVNTAYVLRVFGEPVDLYVPNPTGFLSREIFSEIDRKGVSVCVDIGDVNPASLAVLFTSSDGNRKTVRFSGARQDGGVLHSMLEHIGGYDLFYSSIGEVTKDNLVPLMEVLKRCPTVFFDLSPEVYRMDGEILERILSVTTVLSGTESEFAVLLQKLGISHLELMMDVHRISDAFVKQGYRGATLYHGKEKYSHVPLIHVTSGNTEGCGDVFSALAIRGLLQGASPEELVETAVRYATKAVRFGFDPELFTG